MNDQKTSYGTKDNILWYNRFMFRQQLPFLWEEIGALHLALLGLTAGRLTGRQNMATILNLENPLQVKLFGVLLCL